MMKRLFVQSYERVLRFSGHQVIECADANQALAILDRRSGSIDVMIADYALPGMTGLALAHDVARTAPWIQTLVISGHRTPAAECRRMEGVAFLAKPFGTADVLNALRKCKAPSAKRPRSARLPSMSLTAAM